MNLFGPRLGHTVQLVRPGCISINLVAHVGNSKEKNIAFCYFFYVLIIIIFTILKTYS